MSLFFFVSFGAGFIDSIIGGGLIVTNAGYVDHSAPIPCCYPVFGTKLALLKGNRFVRIFFLLVVFGTILRFAGDILFKGRS